MNCCVKYDCQYKDTYDSTIIEKCAFVNKNLNDELISWKNKINDNDQWDHYKKYTNKYEMIFASKNKFLHKKPISRAYFKLWEIIHDFQLFNLNKVYKTAHIAEGPGGFIECLVDYFKKYGVNYSEIHGITLESHEKKIPCWKLSKGILNSNRIKLFQNNNGNLYFTKNIDEFVSAVGEETCDFITGDGGFDFSSDFNNQEQQSFKLMVSQVYTALLIQKESGHFVLKVFDIFSLDTIKLIATCASCYKEFYIIKPNTSRPANSEKYILFSGFKKTDANIANIKTIIRSSINENNMTHSLKNIDNLTSVMKLLTKFNTLYTVNQIKNIQDALSIKDLSNAEIEDIQNKNVMICKKWCDTYNLV